MEQLELPLADPLNKKIVDLLMEFFNNDIVKVVRWLKTENPHMGNVAPLTMIACGRGFKVLKFAEGCKDENGWTFTTPTSSTPT